MPLIAGLIDALLLHRAPQFWLRALLPWGLLCAGMLAVTHSAQPVTTDIVVPLWERPFVAGDSLAFYAGKVIWPTLLGIDYGRNPVWLMTHKWAFLTGGIGLALCLSAWTARRRLRAPAASFGIFAAALLPTLGLTPFVFQIYSTVADRYLYLALLGPALALAWGLRILWTREETRPLRLVSGCLCGMVLLLLARGSALQTLCWQNSIALFTQALAANPQSWGAANNLGSVLLDQNRPQAALAPLETAVRLRPEYAEAHANLGVAWYRIGNAPRAEKEFRAATEMKPEFVTGWNGLGASLMAEGHSGEAAGAFRQALSLQPGSSQTRNNLRLAQAASGSRGFTPTR